MGLVLLLTADDYDETKRRFKSEAFEPYDDDDGSSGISVFDYDCGVARSGGECGHADAFYRPPIPEDHRQFFFWHFDPAVALAGMAHNIVANPSTSGDDCHREIRGLAKKAAKKFFRGSPLPPYVQGDRWVGIFQCDDGTRREITGPDDCTPQAPVPEPLPAA